MGKSIKNLSSVTVRGHYGDALLNPHFVPDVLFAIRHEPRQWPASPVSSSRICRIT